jgi:cyclic beta-1,2-glucan synthetase
VRCQTEVRRRQSDTRRWFGLRRITLAIGARIRLDLALLRPFGRTSQLAPWNDEESIREELFNVERFEQHARSLAAAQSVAPKPTAGRSLARRLKQNEAVLLEAYRAIANAVGEGRAITPAAEWLLDNYHLVDEQIREIRDDLPAGYYRQLPKLASGPLAGYPRVFGLAWAFVAHTDSRFDPEMLRRFVRAYQSVQPLTIGELWAVAITLRIVLVENLRRGARRIVTSRAARQEADSLADRLLGVSERPVESIESVLRHYEREALPASFAVQLVQRLRDQDPKVTRALRWLDERLAADGTSADQIVHDEHQSQGATNVTVRNVITSMRSISDVDWPEWFESVSLVDDMLRPVADFAEMDFSTRNLYRSAIEQLAAGSKLSELEVTRAAVQAAHESGTGSREGDPTSRERDPSPLRERDPSPLRERDPSPPRERDPGFHLISGGRPALEKRIGFRAPLRTWPRRFGMRLGLGGYVGAVLSVAALILALPLVILHPASGILHPASGILTFAPIGGGLLAVLAVLGLIPAIDAAMALVNRSLSRPCSPRLLHWMSSSRASRSIISRARKGSCISRCSRIGPMLRRRASMAMRCSSRRPSRASRA